MKADCPNCGAPLEFRYDDTFVRVCEYCHAAIQRKDRELSSLGQVADPSETPSAFALHARGHHHGSGFTVVGHLELAHERGGRSHEWYLRFDDGRWGWLAEAQGRYYLTFRARGPLLVRDLRLCRPGDVVTIDHGGVPLTFKLAELASATRVTAEGEIPYPFVPGQKYAFADFGARDQFATLDLGDEKTQRPELYLGEQVSLASLAVALPSGERARPPRIRARRLECPACGGAVEQWLPGQSLRLTCNYCHKLLDVEHGPLAVLTDLIDGKKRSPIPLGSTCRFEEHELTVVGYVEREIEIDGHRYPFEEFLLHAPELGFRWLVQSDGHYSYVQPIAPGLVDGYRAPHYDGVKFRAFSVGTVVVKRVLGEFYWRVEVGERSEMRDYVAPPAMLSRETTDSEENWTLGTYLTHAEVRAAFPGVSLELARAVGVAPHQPGLPPALDFVKIGVVAALALVIVFMLLSTWTREYVALEQQVEWSAAPETTSEAALDFSTPATPTWFSRPFQLPTHDNVELRFRSQVDNSWQWVQADLINVDRGDFVTVAQDIEYYHGFAEGESWSEGNPNASALLAAPPAGEYVVRVESEAPPGAPPGPLGLVVIQGVVPKRLLFYGLVALALPLVALALYIHRIERQRWENSNLVSDMSGGDDS